MTILEQPIDPDQVQLVPNPIAAICIYVVVVIVVLLIGYKSIITTSNKDKKGKISAKSYLLRTFGAVFIMATSVWGSLFLINTYTYKVPGLNNFTKPDSGPYTFTVGNKQSFTDAYRDEINDAVADKLSDYDMPECAIDKEYYKSLLCSDGDYGGSIAANRDGKTYTLTPKLSYDKDTSIVTLDVDIEEGYHH